MAVFEGILQKWLYLQGILQLKDIAKMAVFEGILQKWQVIAKGILQYKGYCS